MSLFLFQCGHPVIIIYVVVHSTHLQNTRSKDQEIKKVVATCPGDDAPLVTPTLLAWWLAVFKRNDGAHTRATLSWRGETVAVSLSSEQSTCSVPWTQQTHNSLRSTSDRGPDCSSPDSALVFWELEVTPGYRLTQTLTKQEVSLQGTFGEGNIIVCCCKVHCGERFGFACVFLLYECLVTACRPITSLLGVESHLTGREVVVVVYYYYYYYISPLSDQASAWHPGSAAIDRLHCGCVHTEEATADS